MSYRRQTWMWTQACEALSQAERLRQQFFHRGRQAAWEPPVDLIQRGAHLQVVVALPGVAPEQVSLRLDDDGLLIEAARSHTLISDAATIHTLEIPYGRFARRIMLPSGAYELKEKFIRDGCLTLHLIKHA